MGPTHRRQSPRLNRLVGRLPPGLAGRWRDDAGPVPAGPPHRSERDVTLALMAALTERAVAALTGRPPDADLPHPLVTEANLGFHLDRAAASGAVLGSSSSQLSPLSGPALAAQATTDQALIHCLHQLDHRTRWQERRIAELEARLAEVTRATTDHRATRSGGVGSGPTVAILHADHGVRGGFERHLATVAAGLVDRGWSVEVIGLDAKHPRTRLFGLPIDPVHLEFHRDYFGYLSLVAQVAELDLSGHDVVLTSQPPTYLARHRRKVALFYHQARQFYDLSRPYSASRFAADDIHRAAVESVRTIDRAGLPGVRHWLAGSATSAARLGRYWSVDDDTITAHRAPPACAVPERAAPYDPAGPVVHVGRMEWPKRPELAVQAIHLLRSGRRARFVGGGSRADFVASLDARLSDQPEAAAELDETETWLNRGIYTAGWQPWPIYGGGRGDGADGSGPADGHVDGPDRLDGIDGLDGPGSPVGPIDFVGPVDDAERDRHYREAAVVVAPAHNEDYGLTALEAMAFARPVVVCSDGGGLTELVEHEVTGLVVEPTPMAVAAGIDRLLADPALAEALGRAGHHRIRSLDGQRDLARLAEALDQARLDDVVGQAGLDPAPGRARSDDLLERSQVGSAADRP